MGCVSLQLRKIFLAGSTALALSACATVDQNQAFDSLKTTLGDRVSQDTAWRRDADADKAAADKVNELAAKELGFDDAVQVALLNNRELQAHYAEFGIANADLVQAGLLSNPVLDIMVRPTTNPGEGSILEFGLAQNLLDVFLLPARKRVAQAEFERARLEVAEQVVHLVGKVRAAYIHAVGAQNALLVAKEIAAGTDASFELAQRFHAAGNISDLQLAEEQSAHEDMLVMVEHAELEALTSKEELAALLGLSAETLKIPAKLPDMPAAEPAMDALETAALERRLDILAAKRDVSAHVEQLRLTTSSRLWQELEIKLDAEREPDGQWAIGPGLGVSLPIFDQGGPAVARAGAALLKSENTLRDLETNARADVRKAAGAVASARRVAERYRKTILPLKQDIVRLKQEKYNFMLIGVFDVLVAKNEETSAYMDYITTVRDYWLARAELAEAAGGMAVATASTSAGDAP